MDACLDLQCTLRYKRRHSRTINEQQGTYLTTYANSITSEPGSRDRMGTFGEGSSGSKYRVDEVCDARANSVDHNQSNATYCYRRSGVVRVSVSVCM